MRLERSREVEETTRKRQEDRARKKGRRWYCLWVASRPHVIQTLNMGFLINFKRFNIYYDLETHAWECSKCCQNVVKVPLGTPMPSYFYPVIHKWFCEVRYLHCTFSPSHDSWYHWGPTKSSAWSRVSSEKEHNVAKVFQPTQKVPPFWSQW